MYFIHMTLCFSFSRFSIVQELLNQHVKTSLIIFRGLRSYCEIPTISAEMNSLIYFLC